MRDSFSFSLPDAVDLGQLGDRRHLAQQPDEIVAALLERQRVPSRRGRPADLLLDIATQMLDALGGVPSLLLLDLDRGVFGFTVAEPHVRSEPLTTRTQADEPDKGERQLEREPHPQTPAGRFARGLRPPRMRHRLWRARNARLRHSITSSARASRDGGIVSPIALAVPRLIASTNRLGSSSGSCGGIGALQDARGEPRGAIEHFAAHRDRTTSARLRAPGSRIRRSPAAYAAAAKSITRLRFKVVSTSLTIRIASGGRRIIAANAASKSSGARTPSDSTSMPRLRACASAAL